MYVNPGRLTAIAGLLCLAAAAAAQAGSPSSGTISPSHATLTYTAGPFAADNDSAPVGGVTPTCVGDVLPCDEYALKVSIPPNDGTSYLVTVSIGWANPSSDFDLTILDGNGNEVAQSASSSDPRSRASRRSRARMRTTRCSWCPSRRITAPVATPSPERSP